MKIVEVKCKNCSAEYETLESVNRKKVKCPGCGHDKLDFKLTNKEFKGCSGGCGSCNSCGD